MTTLHGLCNEIASILGDNWTHQPSEYDHYTVLARTDGLQLSCHLDHKRISIRTAHMPGAPSDNGSCTYYDYNCPSITVAASRTPASITSDIRSRLLPYAETWYAKAIEWRRTSLAQHALLANLRRQLQAFPGSRHSDFHSNVYGPNWKCEPRAGTCTLTFDLPPDLTVKILAAYYELIEDTMPNRKPADQQQTMFPTGNDLPLFTEQPVQAKDRPFAPKPVAAQDSFLDLRPVFGALAAEAEVKLASELATEE